MASQKNALIVGASRGLGLGLAETFLQRGWRVTATQRSASPGLAALASEALTVETADIDDDAAVDALHARLAGRSFDLIFVVAGVATQAHEPLHHVPRAVAAQRAAHRERTEPGRGRDTFESDDALQQRTELVYAQLAGTDWLSPWTTLGASTDPAALAAQLR